MARVELREIGKRGRTNHLETTTVVVDQGDEDACLSVLKTMAKAHKRRPEQCELRVKVGTKTKTYRLAA
jgi:hypothetical protein